MNDPEASDTEQVLLTGGKWLHFNQDYLEFLDEYLAGIEIEEVEPQFAEIYVDEPTFNASSEHDLHGHRAPLVQLGRLGLLDRHGQQGQQGQLGPLAATQASVSDRIGW